MKGNLLWWLHPSVFFDRNVAAPRKLTFRRVMYSFVFCAKFMFLPASATKAAMGLRQRRRMLRSTAVLRRSRVSWPAAFILDEAEPVCAEINPMALSELKRILRMVTAWWCIVRGVGGGRICVRAKLSSRRMFGVQTAQSAGFAAELTKAPKVRLRCFPAYQAMYASTLLQRHRDEDSWCHVST